MIMDVVPNFAEVGADVFVAPAFEGAAEVDADDLAEDAGVDALCVVGWEWHRSSEPLVQVVGMSIAMKERSDGTNCRARRYANTMMPYCSMAVAFGPSERLSSHSPVGGAYCWRAGRVRDIVVVESTATSQSRRDTESV